MPIFAGVSGSFAETTLAAGTYSVALVHYLNGTATYVATLPNAVIGSSKPDAPNAPTAVAGTGSAMVSVVAASTGGTPTSFTVTSSPDAKTCTITVPATSCAVNELTNGTAYTFTATATNAVGTSAASPASDPVTPEKAPNGPAAAPKYAKVKNIAHPGVSVLLKKGVMTQSGVVATAKVRFVEYVQGLRPGGDVAPTKLGTYRVTKSGKVIANVLSSQPMTIILTLRAPATENFKAFKSVKTWVLK